MPPIGDIDIVIKAVDQASAQLKTIQGNLNKFSTTTATTTKATNKFSAGMKSLGAGLLGGFGIGLGIGILAQKTIEFGKESVRRAVEVETAWKEVTKVYDGAAEEIDSVLVPAAKRLASEFGRDKVEVIGVIESFAAMGKSGKENIDLVTQSLQFATAGNLELATATEQVRAISATYGVEGQALTETLAVLNTVENKTAASMGDLGQAISIAGTSGKVAGVSVEEFSTFVALLRERAIPAGEAANALKIIFSRIRQPVGAAKEAMKEIGVVIEDMDGNLMDADEILVSLAEKWPTLTEAQRENLAVSLVGRNRLDKFLVVMDNLNGKTDEYRATVEDLTDTQTNLNDFQNEQNIFLDSTATRLARLKAGWNEFKESVGNALIAVGTALSDFGAETKKQLEESETFKEVNSGLQEELGKLGDEFAKLGITGEGVASFFATVFKGVIIGVTFVMTGVVKVIRGIITAIVFLKDSFVTAFNAIKTAVLLIIAFFQNWWNTVVAIVTAIVNFFVMSWNTISAAFSAAFEVITAALTWWWNTSIMIVTAVVNFFVNSWNMIRDAFGLVIDWIVEKITWWNGVTMGVINSIVGFFQSLGSSIIGAVGGAIDWLVDKFNFLRGVASSVVEGIKGFFRGIGSAVTSGFRSAVNSLVGGINTIINTINKIPGVGIPNIPKLQEGGFIKGSREGQLVVVGENFTDEFVVPANKMGGGGSPVNVSFNNVSVRSNEDINLLANKVGQVLGRQEVLSSKQAF